MKQLKVLPLVAIISGLMVGCGGGGGGGGGPVAPKYNWQMVNLYSALDTSVAAGCSTFGEVDGTTDRVIAARVADQGFKVLYHDVNGSVISEHTVVDIPTNGIVTVDSGLVPDGGYVSVEELDGSIGGAQDVYMFTVQKELLRNLVVNVRQSQSSSNACYRGDQYEEDFFEDAVVNVAQVSGSTSYYQTSFVDANVNGGVIASNLPVNAPLVTSKSVLVTAFDDFSNDQYESLEYFSMAPGSTIYDKNDNTNVETIFPEAVDQNDVNFSVTGVTVHDASEVQLAYQNEVYSWQPIYDASSVLSYTTSNLAAQGWSVSVYGLTTGANWGYHSITSFEGLDVNLSAPNLSSFNSTSITSSCTEGAYCVAGTGYSPNDFTMQRTHLRSTTTNSSRNFYQTIIAAPTSTQTLMESSDETLQPNGASDRIEVTLGDIDVDNTDEVMYFLENNIDYQSLITATPEEFTDVNGSVSFVSDQRRRVINLMSEDLTIVENGKN